MDRLLDTCLRLLPLKESLELFLQQREQEIVLVLEFKAEKGGS